MRKLIGALFTFVLIFIVVYYVIITFAVVKVADSVNSDERPLFEQIGAGVKSISDDFNAGFNQDSAKSNKTFVLDSLKQDTIK